MNVVSAYSWLIPRESIKFGVPILVMLCHQALCTSD